MAVSLNDLKNIELKQIDRAAPVVLLLLILYLCWKLAALFWLLIAPPQAMQLDRVELGSQQAQIPNIGAFSLFQEVGQSVGAIETTNIILQGVVVASPSYNSSAVLKINDQVDRYRVGKCWPIAVLSWLKCIGIGLFCVDPQVLLKKSYSKVWKMA